MEKEMEKEMEIMEKNGFTVCADCGRLVSLDKATVDGDEAYCPDCRVVAVDGCIYERDEVFEDRGKFYPNDDYVVCANCGVVVHRDDACWSQCDGEYYCGDCASWCEHCDDYHRDSKMEEVRVGQHTEWWCRDCRDNDAYQCDMCGDWIEKDSAYWVGDDTLCEHCHENNCHFCSECDTDVYDGDWDYNEQCCCDCASKHGIISGYHSNPNRFGHGNSKAYGVFTGKWNHLGLELEVEPKHSTDSNEMAEELLSMVDEEHSEIYFERDGSLNDDGFEIITQPHTWETLNEMPWKEMLEKLSKRGFRSHDGGNCGLHVHVSREVFGDNREHQDKNIAKVYALFDTEWDALLKLSRRTESTLTYCKRVRVDSPMGIYYSARKIASRREGCHKVALNNSNPNTFEFRLGRGTLKYDSFIAWVDIVHCIAFNARHVKNIFDIKQWLEGARPETLEYIKGKNVFKILLDPEFANEIETEEIRQQN